jgi:hypothetical protein
VGSGLQKSTRMGKRNEMKLKRIAAVLAVVFVFAGAVAQAASVTGTVIDKTTGKPAVGDAVSLVAPMMGMSEVGSATTDASGNYSLKEPGNVPYLIRVMHQGAGYFVSAPQGGGTADISVYDVAPKVDGVSLQEHVIGTETDNGQLRVVESYVVHNGSSPPRTQWSKKSFEVVLPSEAVLGDVQAQRPGEGTLPTTVKLDPDGPKGRYSFNFPIQPDEGGKGTLFRVEYQLPYSSGKYTFHATVTLPVTALWVVLPKSMTFEGGSGAEFESSPQDPGMQTFMTRNAGPGKTTDFSVSGTGSFPREDQTAQANPGDNGGQEGGGQSTGPGNQPGGGIGAPINTPDPLSKYKWWILVGLALLLAAASAFLLRRPAMAAAPAGAGAPTAGATVAASAVHTPAGAAGAKDGTLLNALKEELFALESDKIAGKLAPNEYAEQKAALETVLKRALKRNS